MIENIKYKVSDAAKDLKLQPKDIIEVFGDKFPAKKTQTVLTEDELNYLFEHVTKANEVTSFAGYFAMAGTPKEAPKKAEPKKEEIKKEEPKKEDKKEEKKPEQKKHFQDVEKYKK